MTRDELYDELEDQFTHLVDTNTDNFIEIFNGYCEQIADDERMIHYMDDFDDVLSERNWTFTEVADAVAGSAFSTSENYFTVTADELNSFDEINLYDSPIDISEVIDYIIDEDDDLGSDTIRDLLDELVEE